MPCLIKHLLELSEFKTSTWNFIVIVEVSFLPVLSKIRNKVILWHWYRYLRSLSQSTFWEADQHHRGSNLYEVIYNELCIYKFHGIFLNICLAHNFKEAFHYRICNGFLFDFLNQIFYVRWVKVLSTRNWHDTDSGEKRDQSTAGTTSIRKTCGILRSHDMTIVNTTGMYYMGCLCL